MRAWRVRPLPSPAAPAFGRDGRLRLALLLMHRVYVDESGDRGTKPTSSDHFVVSAIIVPDPLDAQVRAQLANLAYQLGRKPGQVLHFRNLTHPQKVKATQDIAASSVAAITNVIVCKRHLHGVGSPGNTSYITRPDPMYLWALRLLLERISWWIRDHGGGSSIVTFAHVKNFPAQKLHNYRQALELSSTSIHWPSFAGHQFRVAGMAAVQLLQLADSTASALYSAIEPDQFGNIEDRYLRNIAPKLYRYASSPVTSYGLKVFPPAQADPGGSLHRLRNY